MVPGEIGLVQRGAGCFSVEQLGLTGGDVGEPNLRVGSLSGVGVPDEVPVEFGGADIQHHVGVGDLGLGGLAKGRRGTESEACVHEARRQRG